MKHIQKAALALASSGFTKAFVAPRINTATFCSAMSAASFYVSEPALLHCNPCLIRPSLLLQQHLHAMCHSSSYLGQIIFMLQDLSGVKSDGSTLDDHWLAVLCFFSGYKYHFL